MCVVCGCGAFLCTRVSAQHVSMLCGLCTCACACLVCVCRGRRSCAQPRAQLPALLLCRSVSSELGSGKLARKGPECLLALPVGVHPSSLGAGGWDVTGLLMSSGLWGQQVGVGSSGPIPVRAVPGRVSTHPGHLVSWASFHICPCMWLWAVPGQVLGQVTAV